MLFIGIVTFPYHSIANSQIFNLQPRTETPSIPKAVQNDQSDDDLPLPNLADLDKADDTQKFDTQNFIKNKMIDLVTKSLQNLPQSPSQKSKDLAEKSNQNDEQTTQKTADDFGQCHPKAYQVGIKHFKYDEALKSDLVWSGYGVKNHRKYLIHKQAKPALDEMVKAAKKDGITLKPNSIFRSISRQKQIVDTKLKTQKPYDIYHVSSPAGYSEHHTGLAIDFNSIDKTFDRSSAYRWLLKNAQKFGFEQTFTKEYSEWSGVSEESWHWRYVGKNGEFTHVFQASINREC